ncbi:MAG: hypothetical protein L6Q71_08975 [Planctomycetes bacterium]|nr:hypothetical protein [Planctomycetota bacterium]
MRPDDGLRVEPVPRPIAVLRAVSEGRDGGLLMPEPAEVPGLMGFLMDELAGRVGPFTCGGAGCGAF